MADKQELIVLDRDAVMKLWLYDQVACRAVTEAKAEELWRQHRDRSRFAVENVSNAGDAHTLIKQMRDMRTPLGRVVFKRYGGKMHVIIKGNPRVRTILSGTKYGVRNAKVIGLGIGKHGAMNSAKGGTIVTCILVTAWNIADFFLRDEATLGQLLGKIGMDLAKTIIAGAVGFAVAATLGSLTVVSSIAWGPFVLAAVAGYFAGKALDALDTKYQLTERVQAFFERAIDRWDAAVASGRRGVREAAGDLIDAVRYRVIDLAADAIRDGIRRSLPSMPQLLPRF